MKLIRIKELDTDIFEQISRLWLAAGVSNPARKDDLESVQYNLSNTGEILLVLDGKEAVGTAWLSHDYRRLYIHHMAVKPTRQNQGIGRLLLLVALQIAQNYGFQAKLEVHAENSAARHLYQSMGFIELGDYMVMIKRN